MCIRAAAKITQKYFFLPNKDFYELQNKMTTLNELGKAVLENEYIENAEKIFGKNQKNAVEKLKIALNALTTKINDAKIKKLKIFFDTKLNFVKEFKLRGVPTTIFINKKGEEFARIIGETNFQDEKFIKWLMKYD